MYVMFFKNSQKFSLDFAADPAKKAVQSNNFLKLNGPSFNSAFAIFLFSNVLK